MKMIYKSEIENFYDLVEFVESVQKQSPNRDPGTIRIKGTVEVTF